MTANGSTLASGGSMAAGGALALSAAVTSGATPLTRGQVNFCDATAKFCTGIHVLATAQLTKNGTARFELHPGLGSHSYKAVFLGTPHGSAAYAGSASTASTLTVTGTAPTTTTLTMSGLPGNYGLSAAVGSFERGDSAVGPTGKVSFVDTSNANAVLATATLGQPAKGAFLTSISGTASNDYAWSVVSADFNGDGYLDLATSEYSSGQVVSVALGDGTGNFPTTVNTSVPTLTVPILAADLNGDGIVDLVVKYSYMNTMAVLLGKGDGTFTAVTKDTFPANFVARAGVAADLNGDGIPDLALWDGYSMHILLGKGDGTFTEVTKALPYANVMWGTVVAGDFNGDGIADLAGVDQGGGNLYVMLGKGDGSFTAAEDIAINMQWNPQANSLVVSDFNDDGKADLALAIYASPAAVSVFMGKGDGTFQPAVNAPVSAGIYPNDVYAGDFNGDGIADLAAMHGGSGAVAILLGKGDGSFTAAAAGGVEMPCCSMVLAGDYNGSGATSLLGVNLDTVTTTLLTPQNRLATATVQRLAPVSGVAKHEVEASYGGDAGHAASTSATVELLEAVTAPVIKLASGTYTSAQTVTITDATPGATIYYTATGVMGAWNTPYGGPITLNTAGVEQITAWATKDGFVKSPIVAASYVLNLPKLPALTLSPAPGSYATAQTVTIKGAAPGGAIYYSTNGLSPAIWSKPYTGPFPVAASETVWAYATATGHSASDAVAGEYFIGSAAADRFAYTVAGSNALGYSGDGGQATAAILNWPQAVAKDKAGNLYIADTGNNVVRAVDAKTGIIRTVAGNGTCGYSGDGKAATLAQLCSPLGMAFDSGGNLYVADWLNSVVRKVTASTGIITTVAGKPGATALGDGGPATSAQVQEPTGVAFDSADNLYISTLDNRVRKVLHKDGTIRTVAGNGSASYSGDGGPATNAALDGPSGLAVTGGGDIYIADSKNDVIRKVTASKGVITTVAGNPGATDLGDGGPATSARLDYPNGVALDGAGNLYISEAFYSPIREVTASDQIIRSLSAPSYWDFEMDGRPASQAIVYHAYGLGSDRAGNLYIAEGNSGRIRMLTAPMAAPSKATATPAISPAGGTFGKATTATITCSTPGAAIYVTLDGSAPTTASAGYHGPISISGPVTIKAVAVAPGTIPSAVATASFAVTAAPVATITTVAGDGGYGNGISGGGPATSASLGWVLSATADRAGNIYVADSSNHVIWKVSKATGVLTVAAGTLGVSGFAGDGGAATAAQLNQPSHVTFDRFGNLYIADTQNQRIRRVSAATGLIGTVAGSGGWGSFSGDGGAATSATLSNPQSVTVDAGGNLYIADSGNRRVRKVSAATGIIDTIAGNDSFGAPGDGGPATAATLSKPVDVQVDSDGNVYIADERAGRVRKVKAGSGTISTLAGNGTPGISDDGGPATAVEVQPEGLALDGAGQLYISSGAAVHVMPTAGGTIASFAGNGYTGFNGDGGAAGMASLSSPSGLGMDAAGNLYVADGGNGRVRKVSFTQTAAKPKIAPAGGAYTGQQTITLTDATPGAAIYFTADGTAPNIQATRYTGPITLKKSRTIRAIAVAPGMGTSPEASAAYVIQ